MSGVPSSCATHPGCISAPILSNKPILFPAIVVVAASKTNGGLLSVGTAIAMGFVPNLASAPKVGTIVLPPAVIHVPTMSYSSAIIAK